MEVLSSFMFLDKAKENGSNDSFPSTDTYYAKEAVGTVLGMAASNLRGYGFN